MPPCVAFGGGEQVLRRLVRGFGGGAAVLVFAHHLDAGVLLHLVEKALLAFGRAGRTFDVAEHQDVALAAEQLGERFAAHLAALVVVGRDEADVLGALQVGVDHQHRDLRFDRLVHDARESGFGQRTERDARDALRDERLHDVDLRFQVVVFERTLPDDLDACLLRGLHRAGVDRFPELADAPLGMTAMRVALPLAELPLQEAVARGGATPGAQSSLSSCRQPGTKDFHRAPDLVDQLRACSHQALSCAHHSQSLQSLLTARVDGGKQLWIDARQLGQAPSIPLVGLTPACRDQTDLARVGHDHHVAQL